MVRVIRVLIRGTTAQSAEMPIAGSRVKGKVMNEVRGSNMEHDDEKGLTDPTTKKVAFHLFDNSVVRGGFWCKKFLQGRRGSAFSFIFLGIVLGSPDGTVGLGFEIPSS